MLTIIFIILGYLVIAGITAGLLGVLDIEPAILCGLIWPVSVPFLIAFFIIVHIALLIESLID